jgi:hypothetical protein
MHGASIVVDSFTPRWPLDYEFATHNRAGADRAMNPCSTMRASVPRCRVGKRRKKRPHGDGGRGGELGGHTAAATEAAVSAFNNGPRTLGRGGGAQDL